MKLNELTSKPPKILMMGPMGTGKTIFAETVGKHGQLWDLEDGAISGLYLEDKWQKDRKEIDIVRMTEENPTDTTVFDNIRKKVLETSKLCAKGEYPFKVLILDNLTLLADAALRYVLRNSQELKAGMIKKVEIQHWGMAFEEIKNISRMLRSLPICVVLIAHVEEIELRGAETSTVIYRLGVSGKKLPYQLPRLYDEVWMTRSKRVAGGKVKYSLSTKSTSKFEVRSRYSIPDDYDLSEGLPPLLKQMGYSLED